MSSLTGQRMSPELWLWTIASLRQVKQKECRQFRKIPTSLATNVLQMKQKHLCDCVCWGSVFSGGVCGEEVFNFGVCCWCAERTSWTCVSWDSCFITGKDYKDCLENYDEHVYHLTQQLPRRWLHQQLLLVPCRFLPEFVKHWKNVASFMICLRSILLLLQSVIQ